MSDLISRQQALKEMWKALYEYEDKTEKQFQESKDLDVRDWIMNDRLWVQNGYNLCVNVLANLPTVHPQRKTGKWKWINDSDGCIDEVECDQCGDLEIYKSNYCPNCGARMDGSENDD